MRKLFRSRFGAVLQTLGHHTDVSSGVAGAVGASRQVISSGVRVFLGANLAETAGATAKVRFHDGTGTGAPVLATLTFSANGSALYFLPDEGVEVTSGAIYLEIVSGSVEGVVYWG